MHSAVWGVSAYTNGALFRCLLLHHGTVASEFNTVRRAKLNCMVCIFLEWDFMSVRIEDKLPNVIKYEKM